MKSDEIEQDGVFSIEGGRTVFVEFKRMQTVPYKYSPLKKGRVFKIFYSYLNLDHTNLEQEEQEQWEKCFDETHHDEEWVDEEFLSVVQDTALDQFTQETNYLAEKRHKNYIKNRNRNKESWIKIRKNLGILYSKYKYGRQQIECEKANQQMRSASLYCLTCEMQFCCSECFSKTEHLFHCVKKFTERKGWVPEKNPSLCSGCNCEEAPTVSLDVFTINGIVMKSIRICPDHILGYFRIAGLFPGNLLENGPTKLLAFEIR